MKRKLILTQMLFTSLIATQTFASFHQYQNATTLSPIQQISITNMLWNENATGGTQGLTPTSVIVALNNGGANPCFSATLPFEGSVNISVGTGQQCVAAVVTVTITPVAGPAGTVYATPAVTNINAAFFTNQLIISDKTDPVFDTTNGIVKTQGAAQVLYQGQFRS